MMSGYIFTYEDRQYSPEGRVVSIRVRSLTGAEYYGRASWDGASVIRLRKAKGRS